ncbi:hypothetical protein CHUAL_008716 [Chamberlinius hualienensis]
MHIEIQVALNFVISYLYNKLPRRRVNLFGEELERALKLKFDGHWYPEKPFKGSAYRCLRAGTPLDPVIETAARESGVELPDIRENLPDELSIWIDPGEVSYRIGEKGSVKILYVEDCSSSLNGSGSPGSSPSSSDEGGGQSILDKEISRGFNPEAQCFKPIESVTSTLASLSVTTAANNVTTVTPTVNNVANNLNNNGGTGTGTVNANVGGGCSPTFNANSPTSPNQLKFASNNIAINNNNNNNSSSNFNNVNNNVTSPSTGGTVTFLGNKNVTPLTFTTASFAQTKFGSTKLKNSSKRSNRMSPTEFSNYIKQRAIIQQQQQQQTSSGIFVNGGPSSPQPQRPRSLSPINMLSPADHFVFLTGNGHPPHHQQQQQQQHLNGLFDNGYLRDLIVVSNASNATSHQHLAPQNLAKFSLNGAAAATSSSSVATTETTGVTQSNAESNASATPFLMTGINDNSKSLLDGINFNLNNMPYSSQHLLVAN